MLNCFCHAGLVEGQDTDILSDDLRTQKMPTLAPKDVAQAVLYAISAKEGVQVINFNFFRLMIIIIKFSSTL
jgi:NADP-dependent 3-hydroxy acid dehydrogenase YdfG